MFAKGFKYTLGEGFSDGSFFCPECGDILINHSSHTICYGVTYLNFNCFCNYKWTVYCIYRTTGSSYYYKFYLRDGVADYYIPEIGLSTRVTLIDYLPAQDQSKYLRYLPFIKYNGEERFINHNNLYPVIFPLSKRKKEMV